MNIFDKVKEIYQNYYICPHCLGRIFALLGTNTTNLERGTSLLLSITIENHRKYLSQDKSLEKEAINNLKILALSANFLPAQKLLENEGFGFSSVSLSKTCYLCNDIFSNLQKYVNAAKFLAKDLEFDNFLVGTSPHSKIINREDKFKAELNLLNSESFKNHFNREVGKRLFTELDKPVEFSNADIVFIYHIDFDFFNVELIVRSVFISGRYNKLVRGIPQTHWNCKSCLGKGCELCNFSGKKYETSVEELISPEFLKKTNATDSKFHGAGREDIDVRMLGDGRPFILELRNPKTRSLDLERIMRRINQFNTGKIKIHDLKYTNKKEVITIKNEAENTRKTYKALVETENSLKLEVFNEKLDVLNNKLENQKISQKTPLRVAHRRANLERKKKIFFIKGKYITPRLFEFTIETQGGTYIKELINGDAGRTTPSFTEIFGVPLYCKELDVINIDY